MKRRSPQIELPEQTNETYEAICLKSGNKTGITAAAGAGIKFIINTSYDHLQPEERSHTFPNRKESDSSHSVQLEAIPALIGKCYKHVVSHR